MTHFPQPHPTRRAARVQLGSSVLAAIRLEDGRRTKAKLQSISVTGGLLQMQHPLNDGCFVELAFQTQSGPVHGMAEILGATRRAAEGIFSRSALLRSRMTTIAGCGLQWIMLPTEACWD
jgi:hypothetical protein